MAKIEMPLKAKKNPTQQSDSKENRWRHKNEDQVGQTCEEGFEAKYTDLEQEVKDAEPVKKQNSKRRQQEKQ